MLYKITILPFPLEARSRMGFSALMVGSTKAIAGFNTFHGAMWLLEIERTS